MLTAALMRDLLYITRVAVHSSGLEKRTTNMQSKKGS
jgi:hypothetical protein